MKEFVDISNLQNKKSKAKHHVASKKKHHSLGVVVV